MTTTPSPAARAELAPSGTLRVGINHSNFLLVNPPPHGAPRISPDLGAELARQLGVPVAYVSFAGAGETADAVTKMPDIAFLGAEPQRANSIAFSPPISRSR
jgi:polar amino acid transport system substrate-binding protein